MKKKFFPYEYIIIVILCLLQLVPLYITLMVSLKPMTEMTSYWRPPVTPFFENYKVAWQAGNMARAYLNTFIITICSTALVLLLAMMAAYPLARYPTRYNQAIRTFFLSIMMIPALSLLVPIYVLLLRLGWISQYHGIVPIHVAFRLPLAIFVFSKFIKTIPPELDEAALIDGCSVYSIFYRIIIPLLKPVIISVIILTAVPVWNDFQYSLYFLHRPNMRVITLAVGSFFHRSGSQPNVAAAAALIGVVPLVVMYLFLQKHFVKGMVDGAIK